MELIARAADVTADWLSQVLGAAGYQVQVSDFASTPVGDGMLGESVRFDLQFKRSSADAPASVVGKFPSSNPTSRATGAQLGLYQKEVMFYSELADTVSIRTPRPYFAKFDPESGDFALILEDMGPARGGNQLTGCSLAEAEVAMDEAAALHGPRWGDARLGELGWLNREAIAPQALIEMFGGIFTAFKARYAEVLEPEYMAVCQTVAERVGAYYAGPAQPITLHHADYRLDNMLFDPQAGRWPLVTLDWQTVAPGPGVLDVAYFIGAGLTPDLRRKHEKDLLARWIEKLKFYGVKDYGWDQAWPAYRHYLFQGVLTAIFASVGTVQTARGDAMFMTMARRHAIQALDLDALDVLSQPDSSR